MHDLVISISWNTTFFLGGCRLLGSIIFLLRVSEHVVVSSVKACYVSQELDGLGVDVSSLVITKPS